MGKDFSSYTYEDASALFNDRVVVSLSGIRPSQTVVQRRPASAVSASLFASGDHWQNAKGFIGQLPPASLPGAALITADIKAAFVSENVIAEVEEAHVGGVLGREPLWGFLPEQGKERPKAPEAGERRKTFEEVTGEQLTPWWNEREALSDLQRAAGLLVREGTAVRRLFIPKGRVEDGATIPAQPDIPSALDYIFFETLTADVAGVFTDPESQRQIGVYLFAEKDSAGNVTTDCAELCYVITEGENKGKTACRVVKDRGESEEFGPYDLGGRLLLHEMSRRPLITEQVQSNQKALNLAHTMMMRNVNLAGARERTVTNAQHPKKKVRRQDPENPNLVKEVVEPGTYETGAGAVMFLMGYPVRNSQGEIVGYTNPNVSVSDPASVETFVDTADHYRAAIYGQCHMRHLLISGDAVASGRSRLQAEKGYQRSLKDTKTPVDASGRWQLETSLRLAAQLCNQSAKYLPLRADFNCLLDTGEPDADTRRVVMEMLKPQGPNNEPVISMETARNWSGIDDAEAERLRIAGEKPKGDAAQPTPPAVLQEDNTAEEDLAA